MEFKNKLKESHKKEVCKLNEYGQIIEKIAVQEIKESMKDLPMLLENDRMLKDHVRDYSSRGRAQRNTDYINFFDLQWLLFYDPAHNETSLGMKGIEIATSHFGKSSWGLLHEYSQTQKLMMHIMRKAGEKDVILTSLSLCEHFFLAKHSTKFGSIFWKIILLYASKIEPATYNVNKIFQVSKTEINDLPYLILVNEFCEFQIDKAVLFTNSQENVLTSNSCAIKTGSTNFLFIYYGKVNNLI